MTKRDETIQEILESMGCIMRRAKREMHFAHNEHGLTRQQIHILMMIHHAESGKTAKELAQLLEVTPSAITQFVDGLVEKGLVKRAQNNEDRRAIPIKLTDAARDMFVAFRKSYYAAIAPQFRGFTEEELAQFLTLLEKTAPENTEKGTT